ncbi:uncharacterized protein ARMOST_21738 [Armillaria ostoyae]|uniref:Uncharacterized protein n=1 Tax=Armillaria ostoyae TaxID=47428 RepID=A0A284SAY6_ARMOS|nr:uncharacterized protein ARMOST_21738 [Armillaria ostoyae]
MPVSSLQQKGRDQWSTMGPLSIRSIFTFHLWPGSHYSPRCGWGWMFSVEYRNEIFAQDCTKLVAYFDYAAPGGTDFSGSSLTVSGAIGGPSVAHSLGDTVDIKMGPSSAPQIVTRTLGSCHLPLTDAVFTVAFPFHETIFSPINAKAAFSSRASRALRDTIETGELIDTKFYLFSRRLGEGQAYCPKALFSSSRVILGASDYIDVLLGGSAFAESKEVDIDEPVDIQAGDYSYDADSDLESDDGYDDDLELEVSVFRVNQDSSTTGSSMRAERHCVQDMKKIYIMSSVTAEIFSRFKALLVYLYTEDVTFTSIKSKTSPPSNFGPGCSPKSMYRLADMTDPVVQDNRKTMFKRLVDGQFPYAWPAFNAIIEKMHPALGTAVPISPLVVPRRRESPLPVVPPGQRRRNVIHISDWGVPPYSP